MLKNDSIIQVNCYPPEENNCLYISETIKTQGNSLIILDTTLFLSYYDEFFNILPDPEKARANSFKFEADRVNYVIGHALVRLILSKRLKCLLSELQILKNQYEKPYIEGNPVFFNISHSKQILAVGLSDKNSLGVDIEIIKNTFDYKNIAERFFHKEEQTIINASLMPIETFFMQWTKKEAFLKALGIGIIDNLEDINLSKPENHIMYNSLEKETENISGTYHIYSKKIDNYYVSLAFNDKTESGLSIIKSNDIPSFLMSLK